MCKLRLSLDCFLTFLRGTFFLGEQGPTGCIDCEYLKSKQKLERQIKLFSRHIGRELDVQMPCTTAAGNLISFCSHDIS